VVAELFVSYAAADTRWAEWIAWQLEAAGHRVRIQAWDFGAGTHFVAEMHAAAQSARTVAVLSEAYLTSAYAAKEWQAAWAADLDGNRRNLLAFRVQPCDRPGLLRQLVTIDLFGTDEDTARLRLLAAVDGQRAKPADPPRFPGAATCPPAFPGRLPAIWNIPARLATFTGRRELLARIQAGLTTGDGRVAVTALHGMGGIGKTQLAIEYTWRHAADYELIWWINAEQASLIPEQLAALAERLGLPGRGTLSGTAEESLKALAHRTGWLLIFDNAAQATDLRPWLPASLTGHVLVTSRNPAWGNLAAPVEIDVFTEDEAVAFLRGRIPGDPDLTAVLAGELGLLPLALEQAASYIEATGIPPADYLAQFRTRREKMLARGEDLIYAGTVDTCWTMALERLRDVPAATTLLELAAFLGPDPIPLAWFEIDDIDEAVAAIRRYGLARRAGNMIQLHRLVQAVVRAHLPAERRDDVAIQAVRLLRDKAPADAEDPATWPAWGLVITHAAHVLNLASGHWSYTSFRQFLLLINEPFSTRGDLVVL
jgi:hypothetical protein